MNLSIYGGRAFRFFMLLGWFIGTSTLVSYARGDSNNRSSAVALGVSMSTNGPGALLSLAAGNSLFVNIGYEQMSLNYPFSFEENDINYDASLDYKSGSLSIIADFHYYKALYIAFGGGYNLFKPVLDGYAAEDWKYGDIYIPAEKVGEFQFEISPSMKLSPYLAFGVGNKISQSGRLSFSFEAGTFYQGPPKISIESTGLLSPTSDEAHHQKEYLEEQFSTWRFYPMLKFSLLYALTK